MVAINNKNIEFNWHDLPSSKSLQWQIQQQLDWFLPSVHGFSLITLGAISDVFQFERAAVANIVNLGTDNQSDVITDYRNLPLTTDDVDGFFAPFVLEQSNQPHQVLRELVRCLRPGGELILLSFNPVSLWGLTKLIKRDKTTIPWCLPFYRLGRIIDWLTVLELDVKVIHGLFNYRPGREVTQTETLIGSKGYSRFGAVNYIVAEKNSRVLTPIKPTWNRAKAVRGTMVEPTTRSMNNKSLSDPKKLT